MTRTISTFEDFTKQVDYSLMSKLNPDPDATDDGVDHRPRQVFSGHFVPVTPTPIKDPQYVCHSKTFFKELGLEDELAQDENFKALFSGDASVASSPMKNFGWATGYALSIYGTEYTAQCPFRTGNGYGDGRAISIFEGLFKGKRWEMQLKGGGPTPYCRGADGRAVLRSSVREFLAQDYMHALGVPTSRSLTLYTSRSETVQRPWYSEGSKNFEPDVMVENPVAISTRVAPSFLRVGQIELFARRARSEAHPNALNELEKIVKHLIEREYKSEIDESLPLEKQALELAKLFQGRLTKLIAHWLRVGYCQGNFNSDNCATGGYTLDYGPFGFCELFDPAYQSWTGGGRHFSFFNQPKAAEVNFQTFCSALKPLFKENSQELSELESIANKFETNMQNELETMWSQKLGLKDFDQELFQNLIFLMIETKVDYNLLFRELSAIPGEASSLKKSFYEEASTELIEKWQNWLKSWRQKLIKENGEDLSQVILQMRSVNPRYAWREWLVVPAYQKAMKGDYSLVKELQEVFSKPYEEQSKAIEDKYYRLRPKEFFNAGGVTHYSCSS
jgi:uncharacterized protein YdiU (UPF0061 family)